MKNLPRSIQKKIEDRKAQNAFRELIDLSGYTDFYSNDYLGIAKWESPHVGGYGSTGSRLISGNTNRTEAIEAALAAFFSAETALLFNSGYDANLGLLSSVPQRGDTIFYDEFIHASIRDGIRLSNANAYSFEHNNMYALEDKLSRAKGEKYVVVESVYSMDGDRAPLKYLEQLCKSQNAYLIVDEAHAAGVYGDQGKGIVFQREMMDDVFARIVTFGKAYGSHGAVVLGSKELRDYLINFARPFIYTTALPLHAQERILMAVQKVGQMDKERTQLDSLVKFFRSKFENGLFELHESYSPIQCILVPGNTEAKALADKILNEKIAVKAILSPTVPEGKERLRFCLHSYNTESEIKKLAAIING